MADVAVAPEEAIGGECDKGTVLGDVGDVGLSAELIVEI